MAEKHPYMMCTIDGFDRVPDTIVLLKTEDYKQFMKYLKKAAEDNPDEDIMLDPDDCGECCIGLEEFMKYHIAAKPIRAETYEDICQAYEKEHFGFNYVLDAVMETIFTAIEASLKPSEVKWFTARSPLVDWHVQDKKKNANLLAKLDTNAICNTAESLRNSAIMVRNAVSLDEVDITCLREQINKITDYANALKSAIQF